MAQTPASAVLGLPVNFDVSIVTASASGRVNAGDWVAYSGNAVFATNSGHSAYWKNSGAGVSLDSNPTYDRFGNVVTASALRILVGPATIFVSANFSGVPALGQGAYPDATGSGVAAPTGATGVAATWNTGVVVNHSALSGTATPQAAPVATVVGYRMNGNQTGQLMVRLMPLAPDVRG